VLNAGRIELLEKHNSRKQVSKLVLLQYSTAESLLRITVTFVIRLDILVAASKTGITAVVKKSTIK
jgi:hypothetical protein